MGMSKNNIDVCLGRIVNQKNGDCGHNFSGDTTLKRQIHECLDGCYP